MDDFDDTHYRDDEEKLNRMLGEIYECEVLWSVCTGDDTHDYEVVDYEFEFKLYDGRKGYGRITYSWDGLGIQMIDEHSLYAEEFWDKHQGWL